MVSRNIEAAPPKLVIIDGKFNFAIIKSIQYFSLAASIVLLIVMIYKLLKHKKISKTIICFTIIFTMLTFLAFFTDIYESLMIKIFPYHYGV